MRGNTGKTFLKNMCLLLETIKIENGEIRNLEYHNRRFNASRNALFGDSTDPGGHGIPAGEMINRNGMDFVDLYGLINLPDDMAAGIIKCRILYRYLIEKIEFQFYIVHYFFSRPQGLDQVTGQTKPDTSWRIKPLKNSPIILLQLPGRFSVFGFIDHVG